MKLNLGCGNDYKEGWINVDHNKEVKADIHCDLSKKVPFKDDSVDEIYLHSVLEHISRDRILWFLDELWRICKDKAIINIYVPHYTSTQALKHFTHYNYFGVTTFRIFDPDFTSDSQERYGEAQFKVLKEELRLLYDWSENFGFAQKIVIPFNWFFNLGGIRWKFFWEKFNVFGFEEIYYKLRVVKNRIKIGEWQKPNDRAKLAKKYLTNQLPH